MAGMFGIKFSQGKRETDSSGFKKLNFKIWKAFSPISSFRLSIASPADTRWLQ
jgi:hypothetical protein